MWRLCCFVSVLWCVAAQDDVVFLETPSSGDTVCEGRSSFIGEKVFIYQGEITLEMLGFANVKGPGPLGTFSVTVPPLEGQQLLRATIIISGEVFQSNQVRVEGDPPVITTEPEVVIDFTTLPFVEEAEFNETIVLGREESESSSGLSPAIIGVLAGLGCFGCSAYPLYRLRKWLQTRGIKEPQYIVTLNEQGLIVVTQKSSRGSSRISSRRTSLAPSIAGTPAAPSEASVDWGLATVEGFVELYFGPESTCGPEWMRAEGAKPDGASGFDWHLSPPELPTYGRADPKWLSYASVMLSHSPVLYPAPIVCNGCNVSCFPETMAVRPGTGRLTEYCQRCVTVATSTSPRHKSSTGSPAFPFPQAFPLPQSYSVLNSVPAVRLEPRRRPDLSNFVGGYGWSVDAASNRIDNENVAGRTSLWDPGVVETDCERCRRGENHWHPRHYT